MPEQFQVYKEVYKEKIIHINNVNIVHCDTSEQAPQESGWVAIHLGI